MGRRQTRDRVFGYSDANRPSGIRDSLRVDTRKTPPSDRSQTVQWFRRSNGRHPVWSIPGHSSVSGPFGSDSALTERPGVTTLNGREKHGSTRGTGQISLRPFLRSGLVTTKRKTFRRFTGGGRGGGDVLHSHGRSIVKPFRVGFRTLRPDPADTRRVRFRADKTVCPLQNRTRIVCVKSLR